MRKSYKIKTRKAVFVLSYGRNDENKWVHNGCATYIEGSNGEKFMISKCCATYAESRNWSVQVHKDRKGNKCAPYAMARNGSGFVYMHRYLWEQVNGPIPVGLELDHINGDTFDNRLENLRLVTHKQNQNNQKYHREKTRL